jgi:hypothetical protein
MLQGEFFDHAADHLRAAKAIADEAGDDVLSFVIQMALLRASGEDNAETEPERDAASFETRARFTAGPFQPAPLLHTAAFSVLGRKRHKLSGTRGSKSPSFSDGGYRERVRGERPGQAAG